MLSLYLIMLHLCLLSLLEVVVSGHEWISGSVSEVTVRPGDNITLYCDCKLSDRAYKIVWFRNCSHEYQPSIFLKFGRTLEIDTNIPSHFHHHFKLVRNDSSNSIDLLIVNVTESDEGLYYCATDETPNRADTSIYTYGNVTTRIQLYSDPPHLCDCATPQGLHNSSVQHVCWTLLFSLCPAVAALSSALSLLLYHLCQRRAKEHQADKIGSDSRRSIGRDNQDENVCYAALEIRHAAKRPKKKKTQTSDFCTYSAINIKT